MKMSVDGFISVLNSLSSLPQSRGRFTCHLRYEICHCSHFDENSG
jgi:hypothetical protein